MKHVDWDAEMVYPVIGVVVHAKVTCIVVSDASGGINLLVTCSPVNEQGDFHGNVYLPRETISRKIFQAFHLLADHLDVGIH